ncbi:MAG: tyrosine transporter [Chlamydiae bacterium]|nr:tyrosine transporter [Chlamydiota bacterium]
MRTKSPWLGGVLLIAGTSIGAGVLVLPVCTAFGGFVPSMVMFAVLFGVMLATAYFLLDVNLSLEGEPNILSMAGKMLGPLGKWISCLLYVLLLYSLLAAYLSACSPLFMQGIAQVLHLHVAPWLAPFFLPLLFGGCICFGVVGIDYLNRLLMIGLVISYFFLVGTVPQHVEVDRLWHADWSASLFAAPVIITSFGYHIIIPTLTTYMQHQAALLRRVILLGSLLPLFVCVLWQWVVMGSVPLPDLISAWVRGVPATEPLAHVLQIEWIALAARFFSFFALVTSFLGVSLSLSDFLTDGLSLKKSWEGRLLAVFLTFLPPLIFLFSCQRAFYVALDYAGAFVAALLGVIPALMALRLKNHPFYRSFLGRSLIFFVVLVSLAVIGIDFLEKMGCFHSLLAKYTGT